MTATRPATNPVRQRRPWRGVLLTLVALAVVASITTYLTAARPGGTMDSEATSPAGARALATLLRERGVDIVVANNVSDVERAARSDTLLLMAQTQYLTDNTLLQRLADLPGDLLLVDPTTRARTVLTPKLRSGTAGQFNNDPNCSLPQANRAGSVNLGPSEAYRTRADDLDMVSCYGGAVVSYRDAGRTVTVVGTSHFMENEGLLEEGNAALAMNLAGARPRLIWFAPQHVEGHTTTSSGAPGSILDLIPENVTWIVWQLWLVVILVALWKGRRVGPLVPEELPVVVRASETVEGRGRLYRSRRARDRAAEALRTAALQRLVPRLGLGPNAAPTAVVMTVAQRADSDPDFVHYQLYGPPPATDTDLLHLARALDDIERQVTHS